MERRPERSKLTIGRLLRPHIGILILGIAAVCVEGAANLAEPWPLKVVLDNVLKSKPGHAWVQQLIPPSSLADKVAVLKLAAFAVLLIAAVGAVSSYTERYITASLGQWVMHDLRHTLYCHIQRLSLGFHNQKQTGDLITRLTTDIDAIQSFITSGLLGVLINSFTLAGMAAVMFFVNRRFTLIALSVSPPLFLLVFHYTHRIKKATREVRRKEGEMVSVIQEVLSSMHVVKAFAGEEHEQRRLAEESRESIEMALKVRGLKVRLAPMVDMIIAAGTCMVLWFGGQMALAGTLSAGSLVLFIWYLGRMYKPMRELAKTSDAYTRASVGYERIREVLETDRQVNDLPGARRAPGLQGRIELDDVTFGYSPSSPVLKHVSLTVEPGEVAALVGPTGAGKTTIINLIPRFYDPDSGTVKIDGIDVKLFQQDSLRRQISFVLQDTLLFRAPVWYNIAYGKPDASRAEVIRAAHLANADEFIEQMPNGYDTVIGERGVTLSGGQRQRIAIARAVIRNTPILILDEPSTGLDAASEKLVLEALDRLMARKTCIVIAHRLETIQSADVIFVIDHGKVAERGTHVELMRNGGLYSELYDLQFRFDAGSGEIQGPSTTCVDSVTPKKTT
ncbi:MAG TPA: ABC transporter ATP-binding protein [Bryobacteraceae bacterium]|nr:ABC transporter ATP-binding protein [Bryobacteraceae bacterium]